jgi:FkbM family methyltransferase
MSIVHDILKRREFQEAPPVLIDIGASGGLNSVWKQLARYSVCVAFDADQREMGATQATSKIYKRLYVYDQAVTSSPQPTSDFYLTKAPPCSSLLLPNAGKLAAWEFADRFTVLQKTTVKTIQIATVLSELNLDRVDWFKTDSQGTDLRLFLSLPTSMREKTMVAEFEPGILDSYEGEDKLWEVMRSMDESGFWMANIVIKGSNRIRKSLLEGFSEFERNNMVHLMKTSPGWAEVAYLNSFSADVFSQRDYLLGWVCASLKGQHGFALELAATGLRRCGDPIFEQLKHHSLQGIRRSYVSFAAYFPLLRRVFRKWRKARACRPAMVRTIEE